MRGGADFRRGFAESDPKQLPDLPLLETAGFARSSKLKVSFRQSKRDRRKPWVRDALPDSPFEPNGLVSKTSQVCGR